MTMKTLLTSALMLTLTEARADPAGSFRDLGAQYQSCTKVKGSAATAGSWVRVRFSVRKDGSLFGYPRIDNSGLVGPLDEQAAFRKEAIREFAKCFPISVTPEFGEALAGRILFARITG